MLDDDDGDHLQDDEVGIPWNPDYVKNVGAEVQRLLLLLLCNFDKKDNIKLCRGIFTKCAQQIIMVQDMNIYKKI